MRRLTQFVAIVAFPFGFTTGLASQLAKQFIVWGLLAAPASGTDPSPAGWAAAFLLLFVPGAALAFAVSRHGPSKAQP